MFELTDKSYIITGSLVNYVEHQITPVSMYHVSRYQSRTATYSCEVVHWTTKGQDVFKDHSVNGCANPLLGSSSRGSVYKKFSGARESLHSTINRKPESLFKWCTGHCWGPQENYNGRTLTMLHLWHKSRKMWVPDTYRRSAILICPLTLAPGRPLELVLNCVLEDCVFWFSLGVSYASPLGGTQ